MTGAATAGATREPLVEGLSGGSSPMPEVLADALRPVTVIAGHYGAGKTNLSINIALDEARAGRHVVLVDLDVVNPYFRSTEYRALLEGAGVEVVAPVFAEAGSSLDVPSLTGAVVPAIRRAQAGECLCLIDAGGDDVGATPLGRFARYVAAAPYAMFVVANCYRNLTQTPEDAFAILREIERASRLQATGVISNAHLAGETTTQVIMRGIEHARAVAHLADISLVCATVPKCLTCQESADLSVLSDMVSLYPVGLHVKTPWQV